MAGDALVAGASPYAGDSVGAVEDIVCVEEVAYLVGHVQPNEVVGPCQRIEHGVVSASSDTPCGEVAEEEEGGTLISPCYSVHRKMTTLVLVKYCFFPL